MRFLPILFSQKDLVAFYPTSASFSSFVFRAMKQGKIQQVKKGLYALVDPSTGMVYANRFQIASHLFPDAYFSYHEALEYYGLANQSFVSHFLYLSHGYARDVDFGETIYRAKKSIFKIQVKDRMKEEGIRVVSLERAIVDCIDCISLAGGLEEIEYALDNAPILNGTLMEEVLKNYGKKTLYQKVGYLLEKHYGDRLPTEFYQNCLEHCSRKTVYLDAPVGRAKRNAKWNLMVKEETSFPNELS